MAATKRVCDRCGGQGFIGREGFSAGECVDTTRRCPRCNGAGLLNADGSRVEEQRQPVQLECEAAPF